MNDIKTRDSKKRQAADRAARIRAFREAVAIRRKA
jgi:hypothetical protein